MGNMIQDGLAWLAGQVAAAAGELVQYRRGTQRVDLTAVPLDVEPELLEVEGYGLRAKVLDWLVAAADLVLDGVRTEPAAGDRIVRTSAGGQQTYEVAPLGEDAAARAADPHGVHWRVHGRLVSSE